MPEPDADERFLTRREAELLVANTAAGVEERGEAHLREHERDSEAVEKALVAESKQQGQHNIAHDKAHDAHEEKHGSEGEAVKTALAALDRERKIHAEAHEREHVSHLREHQLGQLAIDKAEQSNDKRFAVMNGTREQMDVILRGLTSQGTFDAHVAEFARFRDESRKDLDRRFAEQQALITAGRESDIKAEGKGLGQAAVIAAILGAVSAAGAILGIVVVIASLATGTP